MTKMLLFKPELGTLKIINYPEDGSITELVKDERVHTWKVIIDDVVYTFWVGNNSKSTNLWSFYTKSTDECLYGNIVIESAEARDINAEDILRIKSHIVVNPQGYMIYIE